jgi:uncharacterized cupredoxin-like copper-binding protein
VAPSTKKPQKQEPFMATLTTIVGLVGSVAVAGLSINTVGRNASNPFVSIHVATDPAKAHVVTVTGEDFKFDAPDVIPAGLTEFRFVNKGPSLHHMAILKLTGDKTIDDLRAVLANPGPPPAWVKEMGGPNAPDPGLEANSTLMLEPGNYALICFVDIGGPPHFAKGMVRPLRVVPAKTNTPKPRADVTASLVDYSFKLSAPIRAGMRTIRVVNAARQHHEVELVQLNPGAALGDFMKWMEKMEGPPPGKALGGVAGMEPGMSQYFSANFTPGNYALLCFLPDARDGKPHFVHGMAQQITVK